MRHELKTWPEPFDKVIWGRKRHEVRKYDRDFKVGDILYLREWSPDRQASRGDGYSGYYCLALVTAITMPGEWGLPPDVCVMSIDVQEVHAPGFRNNPPHDLTPKVKGIEKCRSDRREMAKRLYTTYHWAHGVPSGPNSWKEWEQTDDWEQGYWIQVAIMANRVFSFDGEY